MSEFPWNQFWIVANAGPSSSENAHRLLSLIQTVIPIHSLSLFCLAEPSPNETGSQGMSKGSKESNPLGEVRRVLYSETNRSVSMEPVPLPCSVARWIELFEWAQSGSLLQQRGPKPTGKLSWLAPQGFSGSLKIGRAHV